MSPRFLVYASVRHRINFLSPEDFLTHQKDQHKLADLAPYIVAEGTKVLVTFFLFWLSGICHIFANVQKCLCPCWASYRIVEVDALFLRCQSVLQANGSVLQRLFALLNVGALATRNGVEDSPLIFSKRHHLGQSNCWTFYTPTVPWFYFLVRPYLISRVIMPQKFIFILFLCVTDKIIANCIHSIYRKKTSRHCFTFLVNYFKRE